MICKLDTELNLQLVSGTAYRKLKDYTYHHADRAKKGLKWCSLMFTYYPVCDLGISQTFQQEIPWASQRSWYRDRESTFLIYIFTKRYFDITSRKKELTGALRIFWRGRCCFMYALRIKLLFVLVDIQHSQCPRWFFVLEIQALWSQNYDTSSNGKTAVVSSAMPSLVVCWDMTGTTYIRQHPR